MTKSEIKDRLDELEVEYPFTASKTELEELLIEEESLITSDPEEEEEANTEEVEFPEEIPEEQVIEEEVTEMVTNVVSTTTLWRIKEGGTIDFKGMRITSNDLHERLIQQLIDNGLGDSLEEYEV